MLNGAKMCYMKPTMAHYIKIIHPGILVFDRNHDFALGTCTGQCDKQGQNVITAARPCC